MKNIAMPIALLAAVGCSSMTPADDPVYLRVQDVDARLMRVERVVDNQSLIELSSTVEQLRAEVAALRGEIESLRFDVDANAQRQRDLYLDIDQRLQSLEQSRGAAVDQRVAGSPGAMPSTTTVPPPAVASPSGASGVGAAGVGAATAAGVAGSSTGGVPPAAAGNATPVPPPAGVAPPAASTAGLPLPGATDQQNYDAAFAMVDQRRYEDAARAFTAFLAAFPTSPLMDNAQYWLAETHYVRGSYRTALPEFQKLMTEYPLSDKKPDAMLKVGYCQQALGDTTAARNTLRDVVNQFPDSTAARLAMNRLESVR